MIREWNITDLWLLERDELFSRLGEIGVISILNYHLFLDFLLHCFSTCGRQPEVKPKPKGTNKIGQASKLAVSMTSFQKNEFFEDCCP